MGNKFDKVFQQFKQAVSESDSEHFLLEALSEALEDERAKAEELHSRYKILSTAKHARNIRKLTSEILEMMNCPMYINSKQRTNG